MTMTPPGGQESCRASAPPCPSWTCPVSSGIRWYAVSAAPRRGPRVGRGRAKRRGSMTASGVAPARETQTLGDLLGRLRDPEDDAVRRPLLAAALESLDPDTLATALKAEAERLWYVDPHASLRVSEAIVLAGEVADRPDH